MIQRPGGIIGVPTPLVEERLAQCAAALCSVNVPADIVTVVALRKLHNNIVAHLAQSEWAMKIGPEDEKVH